MMFKWHQVIKSQLFFVLQRIKDINQKITRKTGLEYFFYLINQHLPQNSLYSKFFKRLYTWYYFFLNLGQKTHFIQNKLAFDKNPPDDVSGAIAHEVINGDIIMRHNKRDNEHYILSGLIKQICFIQKVDNRCLICCKFEKNTYI